MAPVTSPLETTPVIEIVDAGGAVGVGVELIPDPELPPPPHADRYNDAVNTAGLQFRMMFPKALIGTGLFGTLAADTDIWCDAQHNVCATALAPAVLLCELSPVLLLAQLPGDAMSKRRGPLGR